MSSKSFSPTQRVSGQPGLHGVLSLKTNPIYSSDRSSLEIFIKGKHHPDQVVHLTVKSVAKEAMVPWRSITRLQSETPGQHMFSCPLLKGLRWSVYCTNCFKDRIGKDVMANKSPGLFSLVV